MERLKSKGLWAVPERLFLQKKDFENALSGDLDSEAY